MADNPSLFGPLAFKAYNQAIFLHPNDPWAYFERGQLELSEAGLSKAPGGAGWMGDFKKSIELLPYFGIYVAEELVKSDVLDWVKDPGKIFPGKPQAWQLVGKFFLAKPNLEIAEKFLLQAEELRTLEAEKLEEKIRKAIQLGTKKPAGEFLRELKEVDPKNPLALYQEGSLLEALEKANQRGQNFSRIDDLEKIREALAGVIPENGRGKILVQYYMALIEMEEKNISSPENGLTRSWQPIPTFFRPFYRGKILSSIPLELMKMKNS